LADMLDTGLPKDASGRSVQQEGISHLTPANAGVHA